MKIAVFGGTGRLAKEFVLSAISSSHELSWFLQINDEPDLADNQYLRIIRGATSDISKYQETVRGTSSVFVSFDPQHTDPRQFVYQQKMIILAMKRESVDRLVLVTSHGSGQSKHQLDWSTWAQINLNQIKYLLNGIASANNICWSILAQYTAQEQVVVNGSIPQDIVVPSNEQSHLEWTIIRPGFLTDQMATGTYLASDQHVFGGFIACADVVDCAIKALEDHMDIGKYFSVAYSSRVS
ncbi:hypothetical protein J3B02_004968 [Coemansia erecta]|uniref:NAD(P)-binding domain-containing protein n=1 Tax=Coemansia asiatica TaxID=1052880 RepID=A0A9W7XL05_9FUNG|nr:hypothetical protein LPJ64_001621 [Coemansia asiatica]KAJ2844421.1 hypothetical protein J3B02_004968 [Coemansia erecta]KAJ2865248.1 hypothetical protein FB639_005130 [Coemansia asiatica]